MRRPILSVLPEPSPASLSEIAEILMINRLRWRQGRGPGAVEVVRFRREEVRVVFDHLIGRLDGHSHHMVPCAQLLLIPNLHLFCCTKRFEIRVVAKALVHKPYPVR